KVAVLGDVISSTDRVSAGLAVPELLVACRLIVYTPPLVAGAVPEIVALPGVIAVNVSQLGRPLTRLMVGVGVPVAVTVKWTAFPATAVAALGDVNCGALLADGVTALD